MEEKLNTQIQYVCEKIFKQETTEIKKVSRLSWRNVVYKCTTTDEVYAFKFFLPISNYQNRVLVEKFFLENANSVLDMRAPNILYSDIEAETPLLVMDWIDGESLKAKLRNQGLTNENKTLLKDCISRLEGVWQCSYNNLPYDNLAMNKSGDIRSISMLSNRMGLSNEDAFSKTQELRKSFARQIDEMEVTYNGLTIGTLDKLFLINSDVSLHECICRDNDMYFIDMERFTLGNPNNDLACVFTSAINEFDNDYDSVQKVLKIVEGSPYFDRRLFLTYFIEKILSENYVDYENISDNKFSFYLKIADMIKKKIHIVNHECIGEDR